MRAKYEADDGTLFDSEQACLAYEVPNRQLQVFVEPGYIYELALPWSEVCSHLGVSGKVMGVELLNDNRSAQIWVLSEGVWCEFSAQIFAHEAGLLTELVGKQRYYFHTLCPIQAFQRYSIKCDRIEYQCDGELWVEQRWACHQCMDKCEAQRVPYKCADEQHSLGIYAGKYCPECWDKSGYRKEGSAGFDGADYGEFYDTDY